MLTAAVSLAAAGGVVRAVAGSQEAPPECAGMAPGTVVAAAGEQVECPVQTPAATEAVTEPPDPAPTDTTTTEPPAPAAPEPAPPAPGDPPAAAVDPAAPVEDAVAPAPTPAPAPATSDPVDAAPATSTTTTAPAPRPASRPRRRAAHRRDAVRPAPAPAADPAPRDDAPATVLPADWTSIEPIVLPAFSTADFPVPAELLPLFQAAGAEYGVPWEILAAINEVETGFGRNATVSSAGAVGFMQFLPSTWERWGRDADGDRRRDPHDPADAIFSAARYLKAAPPTTWPAPCSPTTAGTSMRSSGARGSSRAGRRPGGGAHRSRARRAPRPLRGRREPVLRRRRRGSDAWAGAADDRGAARPPVLKDERIDIYACGREDIAAGRIDRRVATLMFLAESGHRLQVLSLDRGHGRLTTAGRVSAHSYGAAADIAAVDGVPILGHQGAGSITDTVVHRLLDLQGLTRPAQIITLMTVEGATNTLALPDHDDHIHVGFGPAVTLETQR